MGFFSEMKHNDLLSLKCLPIKQYDKLSLFLFLFHGSWQWRLDLYYWTISFTQVHLLIPVVSVYVATHHVTTKIHMWLCKPGNGMTPKSNVTNSKFFYSYQMKNKYGLKDRNIIQFNILNIWLQYCVVLKSNLLHCLQLKVTLTLVYNVLKILLTTNVAKPHWVDLGKERYIYSYSRPFNFYRNTTLHLDFALIWKANQNWIM